MSYEGYEEFLCPQGHHWIHDVSVIVSVINYGTNEERENAYICPHCKQKAEYNCSVDETNGYDADIPETFSGPTEEIGFEDIPCEDHYGNKYFVKRMKYKPILSSNRWKQLG